MTIQELEYQEKLLEFLLEIGEYEKCWKAVKVYEDLFNEAKPYLTNEQKNKYQSLINIYYRLENLYENAK